MTASFRAPRRAPFLQVAKSAIATIAAWLLAGWLIPGPLPVFAAIAALLVVQPSLNQSYTKAIERSIGVVGGVVIASVLGMLLGDHSWVILLATAVALVVAWALKMSPGTANQFAISAVLVLALGAATPDYALDRVIETVIGALIGIIVNIVLVPPVAIAPAREKVAVLGTELAASLDRLGGALVTPQSPAGREGLLLEARLLRPMVDAADTAIADGAESLTLNPRSRRHRDELDGLRRLVERYRPIVTQTIGMTRAFSERYAEGIADEPSVQAIAEQLRRAAHDVRLQTDRPAFDERSQPGRGGARSRPFRGGAPIPAPVTPAAPDPAESAALTRPLQIVTPSAEHWVLVGSLLVDLHRIHETLGEA